MRTVLFVTPGLEYGGAARQLTLLAAGLPRESFRARIVVLGAESPWSAWLRGEGVEVEVLGRRRPFDVRPFLTLRRVVGSVRPDVVHAWGAAAMHALVLTGSRPIDQLLVSAALPPVRPPGRLDRWLLRRAGGVIAFGAAQAERYRRLGVADARLSVVAPAVSVATDAAPARPAGVADGDRVLLGLGPIERHKGFREAVWAFDILRHLYDDAHLVLAGGGADRPRVERFAGQIDALGETHFPGPFADPAPLLLRADVVLVPSLQGGGVCAALEAMAAGRPVIASRLPDLAEVVVDGATGFLVEPDDKAALARQARFLLDDPALRRRCGEAGRQHVAAHHSVARLVEACARRYAVDSGR
jgi:glycosyltransferase involved in cell wall biosynthesis